MIRSTYHRQTTISLSSFFESIPQRIYRLRNNGAITSTSSTTFSSNSSYPKLQVEVVVSKKRSFFPKRTLFSTCTDLTQSIVKQQQIGIVVDNNDNNYDDDPDSQTKDSSGRNNGEDWSGYREKRWEHMKQQLIEYREEHGNTLVPLSFEENPKLGIWVDNQRQQYHLLMEGKQSPMTKERIQQLEKEGFVWDVHQHIWEQNFEQLVAYKEKFGDCYVPQKLKGYETLCNWVSTQRKQYTFKKNGKPSSMTEERIKSLESIEFVWNVNEEIWNQRYEELQQFKAYHGDCIVPSGFASNPKLATWVDLQRTQYRHYNQGKLSQLNEERIKKLEDIGFVWNVYDLKWDSKYQELMEFSKINGHVMVPKTKSSSLYRWCLRQRKEYEKYLQGEKSSLTEFRRSKLFKIGFLE